LRVLIVDDERLIADTLTAILNEHDFEAVGVYSGEEALDAARTMQPDVVLSDVLMPKMSGIDLGIKIRQEFPETSIFLFSGQAATAELLHQAQADGHPFELLPKPIHPEHLMARLRGL
jgi:DNA-binding response OmpR family regulator